MQKVVREEGYSLKVYDCYRPQRSVDAFVKWGKDLSDQRMKREFYPRVRKSRVFKEGYIARSQATAAAARSTSRSSAAAAQAGALPARRPAARLRRPAAQALPRQHDRHGHGLRLLRPLSHPYAQRFRGKVRRNRLALREPMIAAGFKGLATEWWHFTLRDEPYPETFFDFPMEKASLR